MDENTLCPKDCKFLEPGFGTKKGFCAKYHENIQYIPSKENGAGGWFRCYACMEAEQDETGCSHCKDNDFDTTWEPGSAHELRISRGGLYYYDDQRGWEGEQINYCPWCGRKL